MELKIKIENIIKAATINPGTKTRYRDPLVGFVSANDPIFDEMKEIIGPQNLPPRESFQKQRLLFPSSCLLKKNL